MSNNAQKLSDNEIAEQLTRLSKRWFVDKDKMALAGRFVFDDFPQALKFVNDVGAIAERLQHHPEIRLSFNKVLIEVWSHDVKAITKRDFAVAKEIDRSTRKTK